MPDTADYEQLIRASVKEAQPAIIEKLERLADHYGIERSGEAGWGFLLAYRIACDLHPGFKLVYRHWHAAVFKALHGFAPLFPTEEGDNPGHRPKGSGWAPMFVPEAVALCVDVIREIAERKVKKITDEKCCELIVLSVDPGLAKPTKRLEKKKKIATLIRRLSEGRRRKMDQ